MGNFSSGPYESPFKKTEYSYFSGINAPAMTSKFYGMDPGAEITQDTLNEWMGTINPNMNKTPGAVDTVSQALARYSGTAQPSKYMSDVRAKDADILEGAGLLVNGQLGPRLLERMPKAVDLRYARGKYSGLSGENIGYLNKQYQEKVYSDLLQPGWDRAKPKGYTGADYSKGVSREEQSTQPQKSIRDVRQSAGGRRGRRVGPGMMEGLTQETPQRSPYGAYDPYRETWWEWGSEIGGEDKAGNIWSVKDLGIQY